MGKIIAMLLMLFLLLVIPLRTWAVTNKTVFTIGSNSYLFNQQSKSMDAPAFMENNRVYVPVRYAAYACGIQAADIIWNSKSRTVELSQDQQKVSFTIGSLILINGSQKTTMDVAPLIKNNRVYLSAKWVATVFGYTADWDSGHHTVSIYQPETNAGTGDNGSGSPVMSAAAPANSPVVDLTAQGQSAKNQPWAGYISYVNKAVAENLTDLNTERFQLQNIKISGMVLTKDSVTITQDVPGPAGVALYLWLNNNTVQMREAYKNTDVAGPYDFKFLLTDPDHGQAALQDIKAFILVRGTTAIVINNPIK